MFILLEDRPGTSVKRGLPHRLAAARAFKKRQRRCYASWPHSVASTEANARERALTRLCQPVKQGFQLLLACLLPFQPTTQPSH